MPVLGDITQQVLSLPREAGTPEAGKARDWVAAYLRSLGYAVQLQKFSFAPASLRAFPLFGAGLGGLALALLPIFSSAQLPPWTALAVWLGGLFALGIVAAGVGLGWVPLGESSREDANILATRGSEPPRRWIVAHLDSKAQRHSMAGRLVAVWMSGLAVTVLTILALFRLKGALSPAGLIAGAGLAVCAGWLAGRGRLNGRSLGARDNGTGLVAALTAAEANSDPGIGILITGAEEFGLVGARVFARLTPHLANVEFINLDTLDEEGVLYVVTHNARGEPLAAMLEPLLVGLGHGVRRRRLPLGIFVDSAPLAKAHAPAVTIGRLTWSTLQLIHTSRDTPEGLSFHTAEQVGKVIV